MLYKLIVLYLLNNTKESLTNSQVSEFIVDKGYTDFLTIQLVISELTDTKMIVSSQMRNRTFLTITADGIDTINCLRDRLSSAIQLDIITYLNQNRLNLKNDLSILAHYYPLKNGDYETELLLRTPDLWDVGGHPPVTWTDPRPVLQGCGGGGSALRNHQLRGETEGAARSAGGGTCSLGR